MAKKRANGEGSIRKRKDGRWEGRYTAGHDPETGKAIIKNVLGRTQAEVKEKLKLALGNCERLDPVRCVVRLPVWGLVRHVPFLLPALCRHSGNGISL